MKAVVFTLGCKVNSCESASLCSGLEKLGYEVYEELCYADLYIINTCAVTNEAEKKSRQAVARVLKLNKEAKVIITGCASQKDAFSFLNKKGVTVVTGTKNKDKILSLLEEKGAFVEEHDQVFDELLPPRTLKTRAYVKIQDGCNNFCSYCIIPYLRGRSRSRNPESVVKEINALNVNEIVLTAINLSSYDYNGVKLSNLIDMLKDVNCRIRLGSLEDNIVSEEFLLSLKNLKNFAPHFHLSLQSGSDDVLKKMNRRYTTSQFLNSVELIRKYFENASITTDVIVGFPTETDKDFEETLLLCKTAKFADIHCFNYSKRQGTVASKYPELDGQVKKERLNKLINLKQVLKDEFIEKNLNTIRQVVVEEFDGKYSQGYTENYIKTYIKGDYTNKIINVTLKSKYLDGVLAQIKE